MSSENRGQAPGPNDPEGQKRRPTSELWGEQWNMGSGTQQPPQQGQDDIRQFSHREHVTGALPIYPSEAPLFRPTYMPPAGGQFIAPPNVPSSPNAQAPVYPPGHHPQQPQHPQQQQQYQQYPQYQQYQQGYAPYPPYPVAGMPPYQGYPGYLPAAYPYGAYPGYNGYAYPPYGWQPVSQPKDGYRQTVVIISLVGSGLAMLGGLASIGLGILIYVGSSINSNTRSLSPDQLFSGILTFTAFAIAGLVGGSFSLYHSISGLLRKRSANFMLPWFWIFLLLYLLVLGIGYALQINGQAVTTPALTIFLIILAALFPALTLLSIGVRRLHWPDWTTSWRRFTLAVTSGATLGIGLALILEFVTLLLIVRGQNATNFSQCFDNPQAPGCGSLTTFNLLFIIIAIVGPIVEETVKPLGVALFIGKMRSASEAFLLGLGAGVGFALVETMGYIGSGYQDWLTVALERTGASLLHGFGSAMVALGWYYLMHAKKQRFLKAIGFWAYAVFQHMVWNGTQVMALYPGQIGTTINNWNLDLGFTSLAFTEVLNILEAMLILVFFVYMTGRLRKQKPISPTNTAENKVSGAQLLPSRV